MTTLFGIKANQNETVVLASDNQLSIYDEDNKMVSKRPFKKTYCGDFWALGHAGAVTKRLQKFHGVLKGYKNYGSSPEKVKEIIETAVRKKRFYEINELNALERREGTEIEDLHSFMLAINKPKPSLWGITEFGHLQESSEEKDLEYICYGSGEDKVDEYIKRKISKKEFDPEEITTSIAIDIAVGALEEAEEDGYTGLGLDLFVLTKDNIRDYGEEIRDAIEKAKRMKIEEIKRGYSTPH